MFVNMVRHDCGINAGQVQVASNANGRSYMEAVPRNVSKVQHRSYLDIEDVYRTIVFVVDYQYLKRRYANFFSLRTDEPPQPA